MLLKLAVVSTAAGSHSFRRVQSSGVIQHGQSSFHPLEPSVAENYPTDDGEAEAHSMHAKNASHVSLPRADAGIVGGARDLCPRYYRTEFKVCA